MARLKRASVVPVFAAVLAGAGLAVLPLAGQADPASWRVTPGAPAASATRGAGIEIAQDYGLPPADVGDGAGGPQGGAGGAPSNDAGLVVRVQQLEDQVRGLNGKIEQLEYANRQLQDQMRKFQQDVEFRFQELSGRRGAKALQKRSEGLDLGSAPAPVATAGDATRPAATRDDAFDPTKDPNAPGAPRVLGELSPGGAAAATPAPGGAAGSADAPLTLLSSPLKSGTPEAGATATPAAATVGGAPPLRPSSTPGTPAVGTPNGTVIADRQINTPREQFDIALAYLKQKDYEDAERGFSAFLAKNPKNRRASDALYYLGETYSLRGRQREAAEQYLKISANYASSPRAPEAMLRLGKSLHALGAKEQACATFSEVARKYPNASAAIKASAERAAKRAQC